MSRYVYAVLRWMERRISDVLHGKPDYSLRKGDVVNTKYWERHMVVVDTNWAVRAVAVEYAPGRIVVLAAASLRRVK